MDSTKEPELKPCPLCRRPPRLCDLGGWEVICDCGMVFELPGDGENLDRANTIAAWNRRENAEGGEAASLTTPEEDAALLWLGSVRDDFRRMAEEANKLLSCHAVSIAASGEAKRLPLPSQSTLDSPGIAMPPGLTPGERRAFILGAAAGGEAAVRVCALTDTECPRECESGPCKLGQSLAERAASPDCRPHSRCAACLQRWTAEAEAEAVGEASGGLEPWQALYALDNILNYMRDPNAHPYPSGAEQVIRTFVKQRSAGLRRIRVTLAAVTAPTHEPQQEKRDA